MTDKDRVVYKKIVVAILIALILFLLSILLFTRTQALLVGFSGTLDK